jgi:hypothetical protein
VCQLASLKLLEESAIDAGKSHQMLGRTLIQRFAVAVIQRLNRLSKTTTIAESSSSSLTSKLTCW